MESTATGRPAANNKFSSNNSLETHLAYLTEEVANLKKNYDDISQRLAIVESLRGAPTRLPDSEAAASEVSPATALESTPSESEGILSWVGSSSLLPRIATVCFVLVVALVLRTLTESDIISKQLGSYIGMGYAAALIGFGWWLLSRNNPLAPVFPLFGALLMYLILLETHSRYSAISSLTVYIILFFTLFALNSIGLRYNRPYLSSLGIFCSTVLAVSVDFPELHFLYLMLMLFAAHYVAYKAASKYSSVEWVRWMLFFLTAFMFFVWASKLRLYWGQDQAIPEYLSSSWFLPLLIVFGVANIFIANLKAFLQDKLGAYDAALPTFNGILVITAIWAAISTQPALNLELGVSALALSLFHFSLAYVIFKKGANAAPGGICSFIFAGTVLLLLGLPLTTGSILIALPVWSAAALVLMSMAGACEIGGIRLGAYLLQIVACSSGVLIWLGPGEGQDVMAKILIAGILMVMSGYQYQWSRRNPPVCSSGFFVSIDPHDRLALVLLLAALVNSFYMLNLITYWSVSRLVKDFGYILMGAQSVIINIGAIVLMFAGLSRKNNEFLGIAVIVALVGAFKVFVNDLFDCHGVPLVLSVLSSGAVAASGSIVLRRWQQSGPHTSVQANQPAA